MGSTTGAPQVGVFLSGVSWGVSSGVFRGVSLLVFRGVSLLVCFMGSFLNPFPGSWVQHGFNLSIFQTGDSGLKDLSIFQYFNPGPPD